MGGASNYTRHHDVGVVALVPAMAAHRPSLEKLPSHPLVSACRPAPVRRGIVPAPAPEIRELTPYESVTLVVGRF
jgi:hypothetical protein